MVMAEAAVEIEATIVQDAHKGGWTYVTLPGSNAVFGTGKPLRIAGTVDAVPIEATLMPFGGGAHMLPLKAAIRTALGKGDGERIAVRIAPRTESVREQWAGDELAQPAQAVPAQSELAQEDEAR